MALAASTFASRVEQFHIYRSAEVTRYNTCSINVVATQNHTFCLKKGAKLLYLFYRRLAYAGYIIKTDKNVDEKGQLIQSLFGHMTLFILESHW